MLEILPKSFALLLRFLEEAADSKKNCIERIELITAGVVYFNQLGNLTYFLNQEDIMPPVGNILGDTLKVSFENDATMYMEVIEKVPLTVAIFIEGKDEKYYVSGYHKVNLTSLAMITIY